MYNRQNIRFLLIMSFILYRESASTIKAIVG